MELQLTQASGNGIYAFRSIVSVLLLTIMLALYSSLVQAQTATAKKKTPAKSVASQSTKEPVWKDEPDSFMGFKFGEKFTDQLPECPKTSYGTYDSIQINKGKIRCYRQTESSDPIFTVDTLPDVGMWTSRAFINLVAGNFEGMHFDIAHTSHLKMLELLKARFGEPTKAEPLNVQTRGGASLQGQEFTWVGKNVTLVLSEYGSRIDEGTVAIFTKVYIENIELRNKANAGKFKDKL